MVTGLRVLQSCGNFLTSRGTVRLLGRTVPLCRFTNGAAITVHIAGTVPASLPKAFTFVQTTFTRWTIEHFLATRSEQHYFFFSSHNNNKCNASLCIHFVSCSLSLFSQPLKCQHPSLPCFLTFHSVSTHSPGHEGCFPHPLQLINCCAIRTADRVVTFPLWHDSTQWARISCLATRHHYTQTHHTRQDSSGRIHTTTTGDKHPYHRWDSNPQSQKASGRRPTSSSSDLRVVRLRGNIS